MNNILNINVNTFFFGFFYLFSFFTLESPFQLLTPLPIAITIFIFVFLICLILMFVVFFRQNNQKSRLISRFDRDASHMNSDRLMHSQKPSIKDLIDQSTSGSGSGNITFWHTFHYHLFFAIISFYFNLATFQAFLCLFNAQSLVRFS